MGTDFHREYRQKIFYGWTASLCTAGVILLIFAFSKISTQIITEGLLLIGASMGFMSALASYKFLKIRGPLFLRFEDEALVKGYGTAVKVKIPYQELKVERWTSGQSYVYRISGQRISFFVDRSLPNIEGFRNALSSVTGKEVLPLQRTT